MMRPKGLLGEITLLCIATVAIALIANATQGDSGLKLTRDYFPADNLPTKEGQGEAGGPEAQEGDADPKPSKALAHNYQSFTLEDAKLYQEYAEADDGVIFLDARSAKLYQAGHIPGALLCHHYQQDRYIPNLLEKMRGADIVVIYCAGGDCEDSIQLATDLVYTHALPHELMAIYEGGYEEWVQAELPVREGEAP